MKVLTLDVGNTSTDACLFEKELTYLGKFNHESIPILEVDEVLVSSVKPSLNTRIKNIYPQARFIQPEEVPIKTHIVQKEKVGVDRLLNLYGATRIYEKDVVVVSAGTALVIDLAIDGCFMGGFITLGLGSGVECLHQRAELIPHLALKELEVDIGTNTEEAIIGGLVKQAVYFIKGCVANWSKIYRTNPKVIITGGDGWLLKSLGHYDPLLSHKAMILLL
ncbi:MAG: type III pantothenate kinase [Aquificaceae bacterium]|nr:type III pantothenate kinase [Aquificaceae bacterium]